MQSDSNQLGWVTHEHQRGLKLMGMGYTCIKKNIQDLTLLISHFITARNF